MTEVTIGDIAIEGATVANQSGGWNAPEQRAERGFEFTTYVDTEPKSVTLEAWITEETFEELEELRLAGEPFPASVGRIGLPEAKLEDLDIENEATRKSHLQASISMQEVRFAETETSEVTFDSPDGTLSSDADGTSPSVAGTSEAEDPTESEGGIVNSLKTAADNLSNALF